MMPEFSSDLSFSKVSMTSIRSFSRLYLTPLLTAFAGGYLFTWGFVSLVIVVLSAGGSDFHAAEQTALLLAVPVFLVLFLWLFISRRTLLTHVMAFGGAALMSALALWGQSALISGGI
tara:strand:+ start:659 stop:1012 length:354 start_codon:yes stop_codon:yes gene_type:complete